VRRLVTLLATLLVASFITAAPGLTSAAQASYSECKKGRLCAWHDTSYESKYNRYTNDFNDLQSNSDEWDSLRNRSSSPWMLYTDKNYKGKVFCINPGFRQPQLRNYGLHDKISSIRKKTWGNKKTCHPTPNVDL
jgi:hypothetical protein